MRVIKVFLADDHEIVLDSLAMMISSLSGINVIGTATNGREALNKLVQSDAEIVLSDMHMPELNGIELSRHLHSKRPDIRLILLTMMEEPEVIEQAVLANVWGYVQKRANKKELEMAIHTVAGGEKYHMNIAQLARADDIDEQPELPMNLLSTREIEIIRLIVNEVSNTDIADQLFISPKTVETHRRNIFRKLDIHSVVALTRFALRNNII